MFLFGVRLVATTPAWLFSLHQLSETAPGTHTHTYAHTRPRDPKATVYLSCLTGLEKSHNAECDSRLTQPGYEGVEKQADDGQWERHDGYGGSQGPLLLPDFHHDSSPAFYRGPRHGFGPQTVSGDTTLFHCAVFLSHLSFSLFSLGLLCVSLWSQQLASSCSLTEC